jgi:hypothetical protein
MAHDKHAQKMIHGSRRLRMISLGLLRNDQSTSNLLQFDVCECGKRGVPRK